MERETGCEIVQQGHSEPRLTSSLTNNNSSNGQSCTGHVPGTQGVNMCHPSPCSLSVNQAHVVGDGYVTPANDMSHCLLHIDSYHSTLPPLIPPLLLSIPILPPPPPLLFLPQIYTCVHVCHPKRGLYTQDYDLRRCKLSKMAWGLLKQGIVHSAEAASYIEFYSMVDGSDSSTAAVC